MGLKEIQENNNALLKAAANKNPQEAILILRNLTKGHQNGIHARDNAGNSILHIAQTPEVVQFALEADRNSSEPELEYAINDNGMTPIMSAAINGKKEVLKALLNGSVAKESLLVNSVEYQTGKTALHLTLENSKLPKEDKREIVQILLNNKANPLIFDNNQKRAQDYTNDPQIQKMIEEAVKKYNHKPQKSLKEQDEDLIRNALSTLQTNASSVNGDQPLNIPQQDKSMTC